MTKTQRIDTEAFVKRVITKTFKQKVDRETLRAVAEKVREAVPERDGVKKVAAA